VTSEEIPKHDVPIIEDVSVIHRNIDSITEALNEAAMDLNEEGLVLLSEAVGGFLSDVGVVGFDGLQQRLDDLITILDGEGELDKRLFEFKKQFDSLTVELQRYAESRGPLEESPSPGILGDEDESVIRRFTEIPGVGEERARMLFRAGFTSLSDLADASVARLFSIEGISLALARDIADYLNPERFMDMKIMSSTRPTPAEESLPIPTFPASDPETAAELEAEIEAFFAGPLNQEVPAKKVDERDVSGLDEDPELLIMFIERFRIYVAHIGRLIDSVGQEQEGPSPMAVEELIDVSRSLAAVSRYMGFSTIGDEAVKVTEAAGDLGRRPEDRDTSSFDVIRTAHTRLISDLERLKRSAEGQEDAVSDTEMETLDTLMTRWRELDDLYTQVGMIMDRASAIGNLDEETRKTLKGKTTEIDEVASSLSQLLDKVK
jgi:hypothetical protein